MSTVSLTRRLWETKADPAEHPPVRALEIALEDLRDRDDVQHVVVAVMLSDERYGYYQAGKLPAWTVPALLNMVGRAIEED